MPQNKLAQTTSHKNKFMLVVRNYDSNTLTEIREYSSSVSELYKNLENEMRGLDPYTPVHLASYELESQYERRHWIVKMKLSSDITFMKRS